MFFLTSLSCLGFLELMGRKNRELRATISRLERDKREMIFNCMSVSRHNKYLQKCMRHLKKFHAKELKLKPPDAWKGEKAKLLEQIEELKNHKKLMELQELFPVLRLQSDIDKRNAMAVYIKYCPDDRWDTKEVEKMSRQDRRPQLPVVTDRGTQRRLAKVVKNGQERFSATHVKLYVMDGQTPQKGDHASHLCHDLSCLKCLVWEPDHVNYSRRTCETKGTCVGHIGHPDCRFHDCTPYIRPKPKKRSVSYAK